MGRTTPQIRYIFINGRGSSGKDTQADLLLEDIPGAVRVSTGDIVRGAQTPNGEYGRFYTALRPYMADSQSGGFIPDSAMLPIVQEVVSELLAKGKETFIFTGFPRTKEQLKAVDRGRLVPKGYKAQNDFLCFSVLESQSVGRAATRRTIAESTGQKIRKDDEPTVVETRLKTYRDLTEPMLRELMSWTRKERLKIIKSNGTIAEVRERTRQALGITPRPGGERAGRKLL